MADWIYTLYTAPDGGNFPIRNSVNAEYMRRLNDYARAVAAQVNQCH